MSRDHIITNYCTPKKKATVFGHLDQTRKILDKKSEQLALEMENVFFPQIEK